MKLDVFYSLRTQFTIIGLTGRVGSGCSEVAKLLSDCNFPNIHPTPEFNSTNIDDVKYKICYNYVSQPGNWQKYGVITYKNVLLLHILFFATKGKHGDDTISAIWKLIVQNGPNKEATGKWKNRFDEVEDDAFFQNLLKPFLEKNESKFKSFSDIFETEEPDLNLFLKENVESAYGLFFGEDFNEFAEAFYNMLNDYSIIKRSRFTHDIANNLRAHGGLQSAPYNPSQGLKYIYTIADTINRLIKSWRNEHGATKLVIDALKNSLELMYFKEKYAAFYMVATNKTDDERRKHINKALEKKILDDSKRKITVEELIALDDNEYKAGDFKRGIFSSPDVENCIQKSDYHIFIDSASELPCEYLTLSHQVMKLVALIGQPGIITPSTNEHFMQVAYNAKFNSGCISRQVGAVVTDEEYSIKAIGWNDVPENQMPCSLRNINDLIGVNPGNEFSEFERTGKYSDGKSFKNLANQVIENAQLSDMKGKNCSFCFKSFHNAFEDDKNQVHTRSLHAEENAMLQITKFGGQGIKHGNLYTTASPCELCSKKAFQLGIRNIYYIDPYPGIAMTQVLKAGLHKDDNPRLIMFQGAVGRAFHKLYEPFMAYKDEISILTGIKPEPSIEIRLKRLIDDEGLRGKILKKLEDFPESEKADHLNRILSEVFS